MSVGKTQFESLVHGAEEARNVSFFDWAKKAEAKPEEKAADGQASSFENSSSKPTLAKLESGKGKFVSRLFR